MAPFVKYDYILREIAASMDLDEDKILNDPREAVIQAKMMPEIAALMPQQQEDLQQRRAAFRAYKIQPAVVVTSGQETLWSQKQTALSVLVGVQMVVTHHPRGSQFSNLLGRASSKTQRKSRSKLEPHFRKLSWMF